MPRKAMHYKNIIDNSQGLIKLEINNIARKELLVVFGPHNSKPHQFLFSKELQQLKRNALYLNSYRSDWFITPHPKLDPSSLSASIKTLGNIIDKICLEHSFESVKLLGHSMGGYGALVYSKYLEIKFPISCILLATKIDLTLPGTLSRKILKPDEKALLESRQYSLKMKYLTNHRQARIDTYSFTESRMSSIVIQQLNSKSNLKSCPICILYHI